MAVKKADLVKILVEEYGYEKEDLKSYTLAKLQGLIDTEKKDAEELAKAKAEAEKPITRMMAKTSAISDNEEIIVMNGLTGGLAYNSERNNRRWEFTSFGQQDVMPYSELKIIRNRYPRYFREGCLIVLDPVAQKELGLVQMYENILTPENENKIFEMKPEELSNFIDGLPEGQKSSFVNMAQERYENGQLDSNKIIKMIEDKFSFDFDTNSPKGDVVSTTEKVGMADIIIVEKVR